MHLDSVSVTRTVLYSSSKAMSMLGEKHFKVYDPVSSNAFAYDNLTERCSVIFSCHLF